jgi:hypothetical protein
MPASVTVASKPAGPKPRTQPAAPVKAQITQRPLVVAQKRSGALALPAFAQVASESAHPKAPQGAIQSVTRVEDHPSLPSSPAVTHTAARAADHRPAKPSLAATEPARPQFTAPLVAPVAKPFTPHPTTAHATPKAPAPTAKSPARLAPLGPPKTPSFGGGQPMPPHVQEAIQNSLLVDLSSVRLHASTAAQRKAQSLRARAFTFGNDIFLGYGEHPTDLTLISHEATHVIQQQAGAQVQAWSGDRGDRFEREADHAAAAVQRQETFAVRERTETPRVQRLGISDALDYLADKAYNIPGFRMFTIVLGVNPINMEHVERSAANVLRAVVEFIPGGALITQALDKYGVFDKVGNWVSDQIEKLGLVGSSIKQALMDFLDSLSWRDIFHLGDVWDRAKRIFTDPIDRIIDFVKGLLEGIWKFVREAILKPIAKIAEGTSGWDLLCAVLSRNPITGEAVPRTPETLIGGFMKLIHEDEIWNNIQKSGAIPRAWQWFQGVLSGLIGFVSQIPDLFIQALKSLEWTDILDLFSGFKKIASVFGRFLGNFISWAGGKIWDLLQIIFDVVAPSIMPYLRKVGAAFRKILRDPLGFIRNLIAAAKLGLHNFMDHFGAHLKAALIDWLTGSLPGVYIPKAFTLPEFGMFAMSVLGITWAQVRAKIVKALGPNGEKIMTGLETAFDVIVALVKGGPAAVWDLIKEKLTNLKDMVIDGIVGFVTDTIIKKAIPKLISMFIPGAGFISAIISIYDAITVFIDKLSKLAATVKAFLDSLIAIVNGQIEGAAAKVESSLEGIMSLAISFLAGFLGLGKIADKVLGVIKKVQDTVDKAIEVAVNWIVGKAKALIGAVKTTATNVVQGVLGWWKVRKPFVDTDGGSHTLFFTGEAASAELTVASTPMPVKGFLDSIRSTASSHSDPTIKAAFMNADALFTTIDALRMKVESGPSPRQPKDIDDLNNKLITLSSYLVPLVPLAFPAKVSGAVAVGDLVKLTESRSIAVVTNIDPSGLVNFKTLRPGQRLATTTGLLMKYFGTKFTAYVEDPRPLYLGPTPDKASGVGTKVKARMKGESKYDIPGHRQQVLYSRDGKWYDESACDMGHVIDAVAWWNSNGRLTGAQSPAVLAFMNDPINYELEPSEENRRRGAALAGRGVHYLPPTV